MDFKSVISQLDQLNEATEKTKTGLKHTAEPGGYGRKDDEDEDGNKIKDKSAEKKGKGRPKKATSTSGEDKKYDFSAFGVTKGKDVKLPKHDKKKTKKHSIKEYLDQMYAPLNEMGITVKPMPGASQIIGADGKPMGTADAATANTIKQASEKGTLKLGGEEGMQEGDIGKHNNATTGFDALVRKLTPKYGKEAATKIAGSQLKKIKEADMPPRDALASPLTMEAKKPDANKNGIPDYAEDGKGKNDLKKKKVKEGMDQKLNAARSEGKAHGLRGHSHCGKNYEDMEEARMYHEGYKEGLDECYGQVPIQGYVGETTPVVNTMASYGAEEGELAEADIEESPFTWAAKNTPKGSKFSLGGKEFVKNDAFAFEALDKQLNALLEDKEVTEGMTVSISKGQQGSPDSVSVSAQDGEADQLLSVIKSAGLGLFGGDDSSGMSHTEPMTVDNGGEPAEIGAGGDAIEVVGDHDGMMSLMKKLSGIGGGEQSHDEETCESCGGMMEEGHSCGKDKEMVDEVESEDQMTYQMAEDNPPDSGAAEVDAEDASVSAANAAAAAYNPSQDIDEGGDGGEASDAGNIGVEAGDADEEMQASMNEAEDETGEEAGKEEKKEMSESSFANLYKKLAMLSEESTSEKDDKAEKAAKKVAKDIEYDEDHKGKDDDKAEEAGKKVKKDIEYDDKKDKKEKKLDEWANDAGPGKSASDTAFETDMDFMMNVISGGLNKRKSTGQTTIPVVASQLGRQISRNTTSINESVDDSDAVAQWKKLAGLK
jgi:lipid-binding SYLF domain-containing protein